MPLYQTVQSLDTIFCGGNFSFLLPIYICITMVPLFRFSSSIQGGRIAHNLCIENSYLDSLPFYLYPGGTISIPRAFAWPELDTILSGGTSASCHQLTLLSLWSVQVFIINPGGEDRRQHLYLRFPPQQSTFLRLSTSVPDNVNFRLPLWKTRSLPLAPFNPLVHPPKSPHCYLRATFYPLVYYCKSRQRSFEVKRVTAVCLLSLYFLDAGVVYIISCLEISCLCVYFLH